MIYGDESGADTYHAAHGNTDWAGSNKPIAQLRGSEYIDHTFRSSFPGLKTDGRSQIREQPRTSNHDIEGNSIASDEVPTEVIEASYEAALLELVEPGTLFPEYDPSAQVRREKVGVIEVEYTAPHGSSSLRKTIAVIIGIITPVLTGTGATSSLSGDAVRS